MQLGTRRVLKAHTHLGRYIRDKGAIGGDLEYRGFRSLRGEAMVHRIKVIDVDLSPKVME